jgi:hypothetical protein
MASKSRLAPITRASIPCVFIGRKWAAIGFESRKSQTFKKFRGGQGLIANASFLPFRPRNSLALGPRVPRILAYLYRFELNVTEIAPA